MLLYVAAFSAAVAMLEFDQPVEMASVARHSAPDSSRVEPRPRDALRLANPADVSSPWDRDFVAWVERKYQYLLADVASTKASRMRLRQLLVEREHMASLGDRTVVKIDDEVRALLPAAQYTTFTLLKHSDEEQHHLQDYADGIRHSKPLTAQQQRAVLEVKLRHKQAYQAALAQAGLERETLSVAEREYAHRTIAAASNAYRNDYLQDVRHLLEDEQYVLLSSYETTEFNRELTRVQTVINAK